MAKVVYHVIRHDGGWSYESGDVFSETFPTHDAARRAAQIAAAEQRQAGDTVAISWEDEQGRWHEETAQGDDRPATAVDG